MPVSETAEAAPHWHAAFRWLRQRLEPWRDAAARCLQDPAGQLKLVFHQEWFWVGTIFIVSAIARCWLSLINSESNDDHIAVAQMIRESGWLPPASSACMECSHPKLFHYMIALASALAGNDRASRMAGNLLNFTAGTGVLVLLYAAARRVGCSPLVRVLALAFMSFNAALVGIFSQATNDGFCILFSSLAIFYLSRFCADVAWEHIIAATLFVILAALSKASGWLIFATGVGVLCVQFVAAAPRQRRQLVLPTVVYVLGFLCTVPLTNPYRDNIVQAHTPFVADAFEAPLTKIEVPRRPVVWVLQDFFTFRIVELLRVPYDDFSEYPLHRESLWSQLYGKTFSLRFEGLWPIVNPRVLFLGRLCFVLGLLPFAALLAGAADRLRCARRGVAARGLRWFAEHQDWQHLVYAGVMIAALVALVIKCHRQAVLFTWMKAIYLFPAILPFFILFLAGLDLFWRRRPRLVTGWMLAMVAVSVADLGWLIHDLTTHPRH